MKLRSGKVLDQSPTKRPRLTEHRWQAGDVLVGRDGWCRQMPRFYRVVKVTPCTVVVQPLACEQTKQDPETWTRTTKTWFTTSGKPATSAYDKRPLPNKRVRVRNGGGPLVIVETMYARYTGRQVPLNFHVSKWDGEPIDLTYSHKWF
jgi:hypothetical protein